MLAQNNDLGLRDPTIMPAAIVSTCSNNYLDSHCCNHVSTMTLY